MSVVGWISALRNRLPEASVFTDEKSLIRASSDAWLVSARPEAVVYARSTRDVVAVMKTASKYGVPVTTRGAGRGYVGGCVPVQGGIVLDVSKMKRILSVSPRDGVVRVQPGVITQTLQERVEKLGWFYPPDPASRDECSIGGNIATNAGGPRCLKYGVTKNYVLALEVVIADGSVLRTGTATHKNKCGFDLVSLFVGSEGLLGVVTEATLRIIPLPRARAGLAASYPDAALAGKAVEAILNARVLPCALEIADRFTLQAARDYCGSQSVPEGNAIVIVEVDGNQSGVTEDMRSLQEVLQKSGALHISQYFGDDVERGMWEIRRKFSYALKATGLTKFNNDVVVPRSRIVDLIRFGERLHQKYGIPLACFGHAGDGNIHVNLMADLSQPSLRSAVDRALDELFRQVMRWGGTITGEHGVGLARLPWWDLAMSPLARELHEKIKSSVDCRGILNPGKFAGSHFKSGGLLRQSGTAR